MIAAIGEGAERNPDVYMAEDEDLLNIMLWRYKALKLWCKWDVEPDIFQKMLAQDTNQETMRDGKWFPDGIPLVILTMHNTKHTVVIDKMLGKLAREGAANGYLYYKGKYYDSAAALHADGVQTGLGTKIPCIPV